jgi:hypothetical protein
MFRNFKSVFQNDPNIIFIIFSSQEFLDNYKSIFSDEDESRLQCINIEFLQDLEDAVTEESDPLLVGKEPFIKLIMCKAIWDSRKLLPPCVNQVVEDLERFLNKQNN